MSVGITTFGIFFLLIVSIWMFFWSKHLIPLLIFSSIFQAASIYNFNSFAVAPYYFISIIVALNFLSATFIFNRKLYIANRNLKYSVVALVVFLGWAMVSSITLPFIFEGMPVFGPKDGLDEQYFYQAKLLWSTSNIAQVIYLLLNIVNVIALLKYISNERNKNIVLKSFLVTTYIAIFMILYHSLSKFFLIPFPEDFLYSNPFYSQGFEQRVDNLFRANGTFSEPSLAGAYIAGITCSLFAYRVNNHTLFQQFFIFIISFLALIVTTATTGYITFIITICILFIINFFSISRLKLKKMTLIMISLFFLFVGVISIVAVESNLLSSIEVLTTSKGESDSFKHRIFSDLFAINIFFESYGLGVGLGSNRPSSYVTSLLSNLGIIGVGIMFYIVFMISKQALRCKQHNEIKFFFLIFISTLISQILAIPDITMPFFWLNFGCLLANLNYYSINIIYEK